MDRLECIRYILDSKYIPEGSKLLAIEEVMSPGADWRFGMLRSSEDEKKAPMEEPFEDRANRCMGSGCDGHFEYMNKTGVKMRNFVYLIGSADDFESFDDFRAAWLSGDHEFSNFNATAYFVSISTESRVKGCESLEDIAQLIGRGLALDDGWSFDNAWGLLVEE